MLQFYQKWTFLVPKYISKKKKKREKKRRRSRNSSSLEDWWAQYIITWIRKRACVESSHILSTFIERTDFCRSTRLSKCQKLSWKILTKSDKQCFLFEKSFSPLLSLSLSLSYTHTRARTTHVLHTTHTHARARVCTHTHTHIFVFSRFPSSILSL